MELAEACARVGETQRVIEGLGNPDTLLPPGDAFFELSELGQRLREPPAREDGREQRVAQRLATQIVVEQPHDPPECVGGLAVVPKGEAGGAEVELRPETEQDIPALVTQALRRGGEPDRLRRVAGHSGIVAHVDRDPTEPALIVESPGEAFGLVQARANPVGLGQGQKRIAQIEADVDGRFQHVAGFRQPLQRLQGLLEARHRFAVGGQPHGAGSGLAEVDQRFVPCLPGTVVSGQRRVVRLPISRVKRFENPGHERMEGLAVRLENPVVGDLTNPLVGEVEPLAEAVQYAPPHQLFHTLGAIALVEPGHVLKERKVEPPADDGSQRYEMATLGAETLQTPGDDSPNPLGEGQHRRAGGRGAFMKRPDRLDHHEGIPLAGVPDLLVHPPGRDGPEGGFGQEADQGDRVRACERCERELNEMRLAAQLVEHAPQDRRAGDLVVSHRQRQQDPRGPNPAGQERHEPPARLVSPVRVLQQDDDRLLGGETAHQLGRALEEALMVRRMVDRLFTGRRQLREQTRELGTPQGRETIENLDVGDYVPAAKRVEPEAERQHLLGLVGAAEQEAGAARLGLGGQRHEHAALADSRLPHDRDHVPVPSRRLVQGAAQSRQLMVPADERRLVHDRLRARFQRRTPRPAGRPGLPGVDLQRLEGPSLENVLIELLRLRLRFGAQLPLQRSNAHLVLLEGGATPALTGIEPHQRSMHGLLGGIEREESRGRLDRALGLSRLRLMREQLRQRFQRQLAQPFALGGEPLLERRLVDAEPLEEIAVVERDGALERLGGALVQEPLEERRIDLDRWRVEGDRLAFHEEARRFRGGQRLAQDVHGLPQALAGLLVAGVAPEQRGQAVTRIRVARSQRQIRQEGLRLPGGQREDLAGGKPRLETTEERQSERPHVARAYLSRRANYTTADARRRAVPLTDF